MVSQGRRGRPQQRVRAAHMYLDLPYAREVGHVGRAAGDANSAGVTEGDDVPPDVLTGVVHWLRKGGLDPIDGCEVVGHLKDFKVCPRCKDARRRVSESRLDYRWAQGDVWHIRIVKSPLPQDWAHQGV